MRSAPPESGNLGARRNFNGPQWCIRSRPQLRCGGLADHTVLADRTHTVPDRLFRIACGIRGAPDRRRYFRYDSAGQCARLLRLLKQCWPLRRTLRSKSRGLRRLPAANRAEGCNFALRKSPARIRTKPAGELVAGPQRYPNALAGLVISHSAAKYMLGIGPFLAAAAVAFLSWEAALMLFLAIPIMVVFFVTLGGAIHSRAEIREKAFGRLAAQFADRIRTLPTILANHALRREHGKIEQRMTVYANSTMGVLMVAFLNAGIIDFFSALAIAVLAVFLGLCHLGLVHIPGFSGLALWQSLFILILAAEFFTPFRRRAVSRQGRGPGRGQGAGLVPRRFRHGNVGCREYRGEAVDPRRRFRRGGSSLCRSDSHFGAERLWKVDPAADAGRNRNTVVRSQFPAPGDR